MNSWFLGRCHKANPPPLPSETWGLQLEVVAWAKGQARGKKDLSLHSHAVLSNRRVSTALFSKKDGEGSLALLGLLLELFLQY